MNALAGSFTWPFRGAWGRAWAVGVPAVLLAPLLFLPLLGNAVAATRAAATDASVGPPRWRLSWRLLTDGLWMTLAIAAVTLPFALAWRPVAGVLEGAPVWLSAQPATRALDAGVAAALVLSLPWGVAALAFLPPVTGGFALSGRPRDCFAFLRALHTVRGDFAAWNVTAAAIVSAWAVGLAGAGVLCVGVVPGVFYAILVSAHATATLESRRQGRAGPAAPAR